MTTRRSFEIRDSGTLSVGTVAVEAVFQSVEGWRRVSVIPTLANGHVFRALARFAGLGVDSSFGVFSGAGGVLRLGALEFGLSGGSFVLSVQRVAGMAQDFRAVLVFDDQVAAPRGDQVLMRAFFNVAANTTLELAPVFLLAGFRQVAFWGHASVQVEMFFRETVPSGVLRDRSVNVFNAGTLEFGVVDAPEAGVLVRLRNADLVTSSDVELILKGIV